MAHHHPPPPSLRIGNPWNVPAGVLFIILAAVTGARAQVDPKALRQRQIEAAARGDVAGALALYADDAVIDGAGPRVAAPCVGKAAIQKVFERRVAEKTSATGLSYYVSGPVVTTRFELRSEATQKAGVERIIGWDIFEIKGDKIVAARAHTLAKQGKIQPRPKGGAYPRQQAMARQVALARTSFTLVGNEADRVREISP
jgi:hypothetical protein